MNKVNFKLEHSSNIAGLTGLVQEREKTVPYFQKCSNLYISLIDLIALKLIFNVNYDLANRFKDSKVLYVYLLFAKGGLI